MPIGAVRVRYAVAVTRKEFGPDTTARTIVVPRVGDVRIGIGVGCGGSEQCSTDGDDGPRYRCYQTTVFDLSPPRRQFPGWPPRIDRKLIIGYALNLGLWPEWR